MERFLSSSQMLTVTFSSEIVQVGGDFLELCEASWPERFDDLWFENDDSLDKVDVVNDEADNRDKDEPREWERSRRFNFVGEEGRNDKDDFLLLPVCSVTVLSSRTEDNIKVIEVVRYRREGIIKDSK